MITTVSLLLTELPQSRVDILGNNLISFIAVADPDSGAQHAGALSPKVCSTVFVLNFISECLKMKLR